MGLLHGSDAMSDGPFASTSSYVPPTAEEKAASAALAMRLNARGQYVEIDGFCYPFEIERRNADLHVPSARWKLEKRIEGIDALVEYHKVLAEVGTWKEFVCRLGDEEDAPWRPWKSFEAHVLLRRLGVERR